MKRAPLGKIYTGLILTFFIWGSLYVAGKALSGYLPAPLLSCIRTIVGLIPLFFMAKPHLDIKIANQDRKYLLIIGIFGYFLTLNLVQLGISLTGAATASLINALTPAAVSFFAVIVLREKMTLVKILCLVFAISGTMVIVGGAGSRGEMNGILAVTGSVLSWGFASVFLQRLSACYPPVMVTFYGMLYSRGLHIPVATVSALTREVQFTWQSVGIVLYMGLICTGLAQFLWARSIVALSASTCSLFYPLQVVFSAILGSLLLNEQLSKAFYLGLLLISADIILNTWEIRRTMVETRGE